MGAVVVWIVVKPSMLLLQAQHFGEQGLVLFCQFVSGHHSAVRAIMRCPSLVRKSNGACIYDGRRTSPQALATPPHERLDR
jgi:hypothetical protein